MKIVFSELAKQELEDAIQYCELENPGAELEIIQYAA